MSENIIAINVPNVISIVVMAMLGAVLLGFIRKLILGNGGGQGIGTTGAVTNAAAALPMAA